MISDYGNGYSYQLLLSLEMMLFTLLAVLQLSRTEQFGYIIIMIIRMVLELGKFLSTFGAMIFVFFIVLRLVNSFVSTREISLYYAFLEVFGSLTGSVH